MMRGWPGKVLGEEDVKGCGLLPVQPPARLELPCREELCWDEERREVSPAFGLVAAVSEQFKGGDGAWDAVKGFSWLLAFPGLSLKAKGVSYFPPPPPPCLARCLHGETVTLPCVLMINDRGKETPWLLLSSCAQPPTQAVPGPGESSLCLDKGPGLITSLESQQHPLGELGIRCCPF